MRATFLTGSRLAFGTWLFYLGARKWIGGPFAFLAAMDGKFAGTWIPNPLLIITLWIVLIAEPAIGVWLVTGKSQRHAWLAAAGLMFMLTFGVTVLEDPLTIANNWQYFVYALACAALCSPVEHEESAA